jgi:DNA (cytosine-5)-methyltransferase 1
MNYFSTFSGIGGFELGIQQAYEKKEKGSNNNRPIQRNDSTRPRGDNNTTNELEKWECVGYSEIDKYACQIYGKHFDHPNFGSIRDIVAEELPDFDLLCGGFPCQSFSIAGKRGGFEDTRGTLFFDIARIAKVKRPRLLWLENVKGLLSHDDGRTFNTIINTLDELGYDVQWQVLNSKNFGVPQNRERIFIIGHLRGTPRPQVFPFRENSEADIVLPTLTTRYYGGQANGGYIGNISQQGEVMAINTKQQGDPQFTEHAPTLTANMFKEPPMVMIPGGRVGKGVAQTLDTGMQQHTIQDMKIRRLTPMECERLQGFPDGWTEKGIDTKGNEVIISDSQRYKVLGNAVTTCVIKAIALRLLHE